MAEQTPQPIKPARREWHPMRIALVASLAAAVVLGIVYQRVSAKRSALLRLQQACLDYQRPAEQVVYEEEPTRAAELLKSGGEYVALDAGEPAIAGHVPGIWRQMLGAMSLTPRGGVGAVLFLHEQQTATGVRGLVCIEADRAARRLRVTFVHPASSTLDPTPVTDVAVIPRPQEGLLMLTPGEDPFAARLPPASEPPTARADLRFFAGQPDPKEPSRLTLPYEHKGRRGELELWVRDERTVYFTDRRFAGR